MKDELKRKLRSNGGVTLLLSLLVFLVCVMAGNVALTAGSVASGTIAGAASSGRAKLDQRYFSVTSAVELLRNKLDGKSVRVTVADGNVVEALIQRDNDWLERDAPALFAEEKFVIDQSLYLLNLSDGGRLPLTYTLEVHTDDPAIDRDKLETAVTVLCTLPDRLTFQLENGAHDAEKFRLNMEYIMGLTEIPRGDATAYSMEWRVGKVSYPD